ncbi:MULTISPECIES: hypothetical protein [unclassified Rhodococcus (in: high G+C Gram-positive bacteria)]|nr:MULTISPECIES: hypothetical protein [unclassified Rhodococcus (in: high G+C Gram-positive bacteria)]
MWLIFVAAAVLAVYGIAWAVLREPDSARARGYPWNSPEARILRGEL